MTETIDTFESGELAEWNPVILAKQAGDPADWIKVRILGRRNEGRESYNIRPLEFHPKIIVNEVYSRSPTFLRKLKDD